MQPLSVHFSTSETNGSIPLTGNVSYYAALSSSMGMPMRHRIIWCRAGLGYNQPGNNSFYHILNIFIVAVIIFFCSNLLKHWGLIHLGASLGFTFSLLQGTKFRPLYRLRSSKSLEVICRAGWDFYNFLWVPYENGLCILGFERNPKAVLRIQGKSIREKKTGDIVLG